MRGKQRANNTCNTSQVNNKQLFGNNQFTKQPKYEHNRNTTFSGNQFTTQASTNKHNLQHFLSAVYNTSEYKLNRGAHKEFTTQIYKPKQLTDSFKTIGSKCDTDQEYLALTKRFIT